MVPELFKRGTDGHYTADVNPDSAWVLDNPGAAQTLCGEPIEFLPTDYESLRAVLSPEGPLGHEPGICWIIDDEHKACVFAATF